MAAMQLERQVDVNMRNNTTDDMTFGQSFNFTDDNSTSVFPTIIPAGEIVYVKDVVSKGAVVYVGPNKEQVTSAWVLSWDTPRSDANPPPRKVYVTCGSKNKINAMTPGEILMNLAKASYFSAFKDEVTKTTADAVVIGAVPNDSANVSANFGLIVNN